MVAHQACGVHCILHRLEGVRCGDDVDGAIVRVHRDVVGAGFDGRFGDLFLIGTRRVTQHAQSLEHESHRTFGAHVATALAEGMAHIGHGPHAVVGEAVDDDRHAARGVAFVPDLFVLDAFKFAGGFLDGAFDHVLGHVGAQALVHGHAQPWVVVWVASTAASSNADLTDDLGENLAALRVRRVFATFDGRTSTHGNAVHLSGTGREFYLIPSQGPS
ncbi:hypothetical protein D3C81_1111890 [compost metagenome]